MLNKAILMGRITRDLELKYTPNGAHVLTFSVAVERSYAKQGEERQTDFITCVAWNKTAEFISRYFSKGRMIAVVGELRSRTYDDKNGTKHYVTEVYVSEASFTGEPKQQSSYQNGGYQNGAGYQPYSQPQYQGGYQNASAPQPDSQPIGMGGAEDMDVFSDDGVPF